MCNQQSLRSACAYAQSDQSLCLWLEYSMSVKLLTEHHLEFVSLKGGCRGSSESTHEGFFLVSSGAEIRPLSQWDLGDFFPNLKKNSQSQKKKKIFFFFFRIFIQSPHTHTHNLHDGNLLELHPIFHQFNGNSMCIS